ncbi:hypothetical protein RYX36_015305, partial [Vicia faba]
AVNGSWKLNVKEFHLPSQNVADHQMKSSFSFNGLLRNPKKQRKVAEYYKKQERLVEGFNEMEAMHETGFYPGGLTEDEMKQLAKSERMAVHVSNACNLVLFAAKRLQSTFIRIPTTTSADIAASSSAACLAISS